MLSVIVFGRYLGEFPVVEILQQRTLAHRTVANQYQTELVIEHQVRHNIASIRIRVRCCASSRRRNINNIAVRKRNRTCDLLIIGIFGRGLSERGIDCTADENMLRYHHRTRWLDYTIPVRFG